jgi:hypothetical protein
MVVDEASGKRYSKNGLMKRDVCSDEPESLDRKKMNAIHNKIGA